MDNMTAASFASAHERPWLNTSFDEEGIGQHCKAQRRPAVVLR